MTDQIERVARAIREEVHPMDWGSCVAAAKAAIAALTNTTEGGE